MAETLIVGRLGALERFQFNAIRLRHYLHQIHLR
jgi:hypothetical protein